MTISFLITTLIVVVTPGTGVVYTLSAGISRGTRASIVAALGCTLGVVPHLAVTLTGLAALLQASPLAFQILKYLGVAYLVYMAVATLRDRSGLHVPESADARSAGRIVRDGVLVNLLNPKLTMFFVAFLPQFVDPAAPGYLPQVLLLSAVFMLLTFLVFTVYGVFAASARAHITARPRILAWLRRAFAASFVALGLKLAAASR
jgi:threonine/homoserine/homoserine lactone efflux protein